MRGIYIPFLCLALCIFPLRSLAASILTVPDAYPTIQAAVDAARSGDRIFIRAGIYRERVRVQKPLDLVGEDPLKVLIESPDPDAIAILVEPLNGDVSIQGIHVQNGRWGILYGVASSGELRIRQCIISDNRFGLVASGRMCVVEESFFWGNDVDVILDSGDLRLSNCEIFGVWSTHWASVYLVGSEDETSHFIMTNCIIGLVERAIICDSSHCNISISGEQNRMHAFESLFKSSCSTISLPENFWDSSWFEDVNYAIHCWNRGYDLQKLGQLREALIQLENALETAQHADFPILKAYLNTEVGLLYTQMGLYENAILEFTKAIDVYTARSMRAYIAETQMWVGDVYRDLGMYDRAWQLYQQARDTYETIGLWHYVSSAAGATLRRGLMLKDIGLHDQALDCFISARGVFMGLGSAVPHWLLSGATSDIYIGDCKASLGAYAEALQFYDEGLSLFKNYGDDLGVAMCLNRIGRLRMMEGKNEEALSFFMSALDSLNEATYKAGTQTSFPSEWIELLLDKGAAHESLNQLVEAANAYQRAVEIAESIRGHLLTEELKHAWGERTQNAYERLIDLLYRIGQGSSALPYTERCRARTFLDLLARGPVEALTNVLEEGIKTGVVDPERIKADLWEAITDLPDNTAVLEYFVTKKVLYLWVITRGRVSDPLQIAIGRAELLDLVLAYRQEIESFTPGAEAADALLRTNKLGTKLYDLLIAPAEENLNEIRHLVVVPSGPLHYVPFAALYRCPKCDEPRGGKYLGEMFGLSYLPSLVTLKYVQQRGQPTAGEPRFLGMADPDTRDPRFERLPEAQKEVRAIAARFPYAEVYVDREATEDILNARTVDMRYIVISTHGSFNPYNPMFSYLLLAPTERTDGKLYTHEVFGLRLQADLVTLSACETLLPSLREAKRQIQVVRSTPEEKSTQLTPEMLERITAGDELAGLTRAFIYAGTTTVMASLWSVYSEPTKDFMVRFYELLQEGKTKAEALQQAQRELRELYSHPVYWAAFQLVGDWR